MPVNLDNKKASSIWREGIKKAATASPLREWEPSVNTQDVLVCRLPKSSEKSADAKAGLLDASFLDKGNFIGRQARSNQGGGVTGGNDSFSLKMEKSFEPKNLIDWITDGVLRIFQKT